MTGNRRAPRKRPRARAATGQMGAEPAQLRTGVAMATRAPGGHAGQRALLFYE